MLESSIDQFKHLRSNNGRRISFKTQKLPGHRCTGFQNSNAFLVENDLAKSIQIC